jgi:hypothetical protein
VAPQKANLNLGLLLATRASRAGKRSSVAPSDKAIVHESHFLLPSRIPRLLQGCEDPRCVLQSINPARVKRVLRVVRTKSVPNSSSSSLMVRDSGDCSICSFSGASEVKFLGER